MEPIRGTKPEDQFLQKIRQFCDENNIILAQLHLESPIFSYYFQYGIFLKLKKVFPEVSILKGNLGGLNRPSKIQDLITGEYIRR